VNLLLNFLGATFESAHRIFCGASLRWTAGGGCPRLALVVRAFAGEGARATRVAAFRGLNMSAQLDSFRGSCQHIETRGPSTPHDDWRCQSSCSARDDEFKRVPLQMTDLKE